MRDRRLTEFIDAEGDGGSADATGDPAGDPAVSTSRWDAAGLECPACGSTASRLWREDGRHVCGTCKGW